MFMYQKYNIDSKIPNSNDIHKAKTKIVLLIYHHHHHHLHYNILLGNISVPFHTCTAKIRRN